MWPQFDFSLLLFLRTASEKKNKREKEKGDVSFSVKRLTEM